MTSHAVSRFKTVFLARGTALVLLAAVAVRWPELTLSGAMVAAGVVAATFGVAELSVALTERDLASTRYFTVGHAAAVIGFGLLLLIMPVAPHRVGLTLSALWLLTYTAYTLLLAARIWYLAHMRLAVLAWAALNLACALALAFSTPPTTNALLYAAALYCALAGGAQILAASWLQRWRRAHEYRARQHRPAHG